MRTRTLLAAAALVCACTKSPPAHEESVAIAPPASSTPPPIAAPEAATLPPAATPAAATPEDAGEAQIPCTSVDDCWIEGRRPIARPKNLRGRKFKPCKDGEVAPACKEGVCDRIAYKC
jgi:hypothetical protein